MYPYERSLVTRYQNRPFVLLGVNSDADRNLAKQAVLRQGLTFVRGGSTVPTRPIPHLYHVERWPTLYLMDGTGTIRFAGLHGQALEDKIEMLVRGNVRVRLGERRAVRPTWITRAFHVGLRSTLANLFHRTHDLPHRPNFASSKSFAIRRKPPRNRRIEKVGGADLHGAGAGDEKLHHVVDGGDAADADDGNLDLPGDLPDEPQGQTA